MMYGHSEILFRLLRHRMLRQIFVYGESKKLSQTAFPCLPQKGKQYQSDLKTAVAAEMYSLDLIPLTQIPLLIGDCFLTIHKDCTRLLSSDPTARFASAIVRLFQKKQQFPYPGIPLPAQTLSASLLSGAERDRQCRVS